MHYSARKVSKYGIFSGPYFPVFSPNTAKYGPEKTPNLDTFHSALVILKDFLSLFRINTCCFKPL